MTGDELPRNRRTAAFERRFAAALARASGSASRAGSEGDAPFVVAASGGPDSTTALIATARAVGAARVVAAHFDHGLRAITERRAERLVVEQVAGALGVRFVAGANRSRAKRDDRSEASARESRYRWLARVCGDAGAVQCVTGHTLDDQAETVLLRLTRGAGALGVAGMQPAAPWPIASHGTRSLTVVRPLLAFTRAEVEAYLNAIGIEAAHDPSNYTRNRIRHVVLPELMAINPRIREHLAAFADANRADEEALSAIARDWLDRHLPAPGAAPSGSVELPRAALRALAPAVAFRVLRDAALRLGVSVESTHLAALQAALGRSGAHADLPGATATTTRGTLRIAAGGAANPRK